MSDRIKIYLFLLALLVLAFVGAYFYGQTLFEREEAMEVDTEETIEETTEELTEETMKEELPTLQAEGRRIFQEEELVFREEREEREYVEAKGVGYSPLMADESQMRLLARRGAIVDAQRNLLSLLVGDGEQVDGVLKGAFVVDGSEEHFSLEDGRVGCSLLMRAPKDQDMEF